MTPEQLQAARKAARLTQQQAAARLGVSQPYLALMECSRRPVPARMQSKIAKLYNLGPIALPLESRFIHSPDASTLAYAVANLGYPPFRHLRRGRTANPALVLLAVLSSNAVEVRVIEALPWILGEYIDLDWDWLVRECKLRDLQNRLGFLITLLQRAARKESNRVWEQRLGPIAEILNRARLAREDTLCQENLTFAERRWLRRHRSAEARHWNLLTDVDFEAVPPAA